jgi:hypothetical protein
VSKISISVRKGDALNVKCDVLILKYAQAVYGVDSAVASIFAGAGISMDNLWPKPDGFRLVLTKNTLPAERVLFIGVPELRQFDYAAIRLFAVRALTALAGELPDANHIVMTLHGVGFGLDESEAFRAELAGILDATESGDFPEGLQTITILERNAGRASRLDSVLQEILPNRLIETVDLQEHSPQSNARAALADVGSLEKRHVFAALPFDKAFDDRFHYGIHKGAESAGFLCERGDGTSFVGNVMDFVQQRIDSASFVIADLTGANANVYLEVGYAWGRGVPTILLATEASELKFDVQGHRCLIYESSIKRLEELLTRELKNLAINLGT